MFKTHLMFSFLIGLLMIFFFNIGNKFLFLFFVLFFGALPDIDHYKSWIGRKLKVLSFLINLFSKHRGIFHSIFPVLILYGVFLYYGLKEIALASAIGYLSHLAMDSLTKTGINFLYPVSKFKIRGFIRTGGFLELVLLFFFLITSAYILKILIF